MEEEKREHEHHEHHHEHHKKNITDKVRENPWILATFVFGIVSIALILTTLFGGMTGKVISGKQAAENLISYAELQGLEVTVNGVKEEFGLYSLDIEVNGNADSLYMTKDGANIVGGLIPIVASSTPSTTNTPTEVQKSDKPVVELYVFTYCPYGLQMEKAMIPVIKLLGDKVDFKIRQIGAMHGEFEKIEAERQLCIEKEYPGKLLDYVLAFAEDTSIGSCNGEATCLAPKLTALYTKLGIDASKVNSCMSTDGEKLYNAEVSNANAKGISGSPGLTINSVQTQSNRSPEAVKGAICAAFNNVPSECSTTLSTEQASAGFGKGTSSGSSTASC